MIELARGRRIKVIVGSIFPVSSYNWNPSVKAAPSILPLNRWLEDYCKSQNIIYVDYYRVLAGRDGGMNPKYSDDGVHPNALAYELIRPLALEALKKAERE
jgi:lysophospholipase L1-like esterase